ncbi:MAG TPA: hypothetical protein ENJ15_06030 [Caldithrix abyssi]|uniref:Uncharacterized protein n=1 Tax=Caldithrix abyssi TaxID=187145 RepID=A0A7V5RQH0_CALAY|nr:hypothetical protein [Caldithrix abyssi]
MQKIKNIFYATLFTVLISLPAIITFSPKKAFATVIADCNGDVSKVCYSNRNGDMIYGKGKVTIVND